MHHRVGQKEIAHESNQTRRKEEKRNMLLFKTCEDPSLDRIWQFPDHTASKRTITSQTAEIELNKTKFNKETNSEYALLKFIQRSCDS